MSLTIIEFLTLKVIWSSFINGSLVSTIFFNQRHSSITGCLPQKGVFYEKALQQWLSSINDFLPLMVLFNQRLCSITCLPLNEVWHQKIFFHLWSSSIQGHFSSKDDFQISCPFQNVASCLISSDINFMCHLISVVLKLLLSGGFDKKNF